MSRFIFQVLAFLILPAISYASLAKDCLSLEDATELASTADGDYAFPVCPTEAKNVVTFVIGKKANLQRTTELIEAFFYEAVSLSSYYNLKQHFNVVRFVETSKVNLPLAIVPEDDACPQGMYTIFRGVLSKQNELYRAKFCRKYSP